MKSAIDIVRALATALTDRVPFEVTAAHLAREARDLVAALDEEGEDVPYGTPIDEKAHIVRILSGSPVRLDQRRRFTNAVSALAFVQRTVGP